MEPMNVLVAVPLGVAVTTSELATRSWDGDPYDSTQLEDARVPDGAVLEPQALSAAAARAGSANARSSVRGLCVFVAKTASTQIPSQLDTAYRWSTYIASRM